MKITITLECIDANTGEPIVFSKEALTFETAVEDIYKLERAYKRKGLKEDGILTHLLLNCECRKCGAEVECEHEGPHIKTLCGSCSV